MKLRTRATAAVARLELYRTDLRVIENFFPVNNYADV